MPPSVRCGDCWARKTRMERFAVMPMRIAAALIQRIWHAVSPNGAITPPIARRWRQPVGTSTGLSLTGGPTTGLVSPTNHLRNSRPQRRGCRGGCSGRRLAGAQQLCMPDRQLQDDADLVSPARPVTQSAAGQCGIEGDRPGQTCPAQGQSKSQPVRRHTRFRSGPRLQYRRRRAELGGEILYDALLEKRRVLSGLRTEPARPAAIARSSRGAIAPGPASARTRRLNIVMLTTARSQEVRKC